MKKITTILLGLALAFGASIAVAQEAKKKGKKAGAGSAQMSEATPKTVIHVVTVRWKDGTSDEQIRAALDGVKALPKSFPGIVRVWTRSFKVQNPSEVKEKKRTHAFVMEFASEQALKDYHNSPAQLEWYKVYEPIRDQSTTHDITN